MSKRILTEAQKRACIEAARRSAERNPEQVKANKRAYYARHRERICAEANAKNAAKPKKPRRVAKGRDPEKARIRQRRWQAQEKNREAGNARQRLRRAENIGQIREREIEYRRVYFAKNPDIRRAWTRCRRARKLGAEGSHTGDDIARIRKAQGDRCAYCRVKLRGAGSVDHIVALINGGSNWPSNLQLLCKPCNSSKHTKGAIEYAQSLGRLL